MIFQFTVNPELDVPIYTQLVDMLRSDIRSGKIPFGTKLPTVRELSDSCAIAKGTAIRAYDELEQQQLVERIQGKGTFVIYRENDSSSRKDLAMAAIDRMLDTLESLNFSQSEMNIYLNLKLQERANDRKTVQIAVIECNYEILTRIADQLRCLGDVSVYAYHLDDVRAYPYKLSEDLDLIVLSARHAEELYRYLPEGSRVAKAALRLMPHSVSGLVRLPIGCRVGVLCQSKRFGALVTSVCKEYAETAEVCEPETFSGDVKDYLSDKTALLLPQDYPRFCDQETAQLIAEFRKKHPAVPCEYRIDDGSMMYIEDRIAQIREKK